MAVMAGRVGPLQNDVSAATVFVEGRGHDRVLDTRMDRLAEISYFNMDTIVIGTPVDPDGVPQLVPVTVLDNIVDCLDDNRGDMPRYRVIESVGLA